MSTDSIHQPTIGRFTTEHLDETDSTNRVCKDLAQEGENTDWVVWTDFQTAGRGCGTNTWESERGKNLLFSILCHPQNVRATHQFLLLEAMSLALIEALEPHVHTGSLSVKWPNDIYWNDSKLGGTLTECSLSGQQLKWCVIGTGLNVNQRAFMSDAPNPVSLLQICNKELELQPLLERILSQFSKYLDLIKEAKYEALHKAYMTILYRREGFHDYCDAHGRFRAKIVDVEHEGTLILQDTMQQIRRYQFKEVQFII